MTPHDPTTAAATDTGTDTTGPATAARPSPVPDTAWEDLVATALLGTERRQFPAPGDRDPATALLDAAAVRTLERRSGLRPSTRGPGAPRCFRSESASSAPGAQPRERSTCAAP